MRPFKLCTECATTYTFEEFEGLADAEIPAWASNLEGSVAKQCRKGCPTPMVDDIEHMERTRERLFATARRWDNVEAIVDGERLRLYVQTGQTEAVRVELPVLWLLKLIGGEKP